MAKRKTKAEKQLDAAIEQAYYRQAKGMNINIMLITKLWADVRAAVALAVAAGDDQQLAVEEAMKIAVAKYCQAA